MTPHILFFGLSVYASWGLRIINPLYTYPAGTGLTSYQTVATAGVDQTLIINPGNGDQNGCPPNADWAAALQTLLTGGVKLIGYVYSSYGARSINTIQSVIDNYYTCWNVSGIFIDETMDNDVSYYSQLYNYVKTKPFPNQVWLNPGTNVIEAYMNISDTVCIFESPYTSWSSWTPAAYVSNYSSTKFCAIVLNTSSYAAQDTFFQQASGANIAYVGALGPGQVDWNTLSTQWCDEVDYVKAHPGPAPFGPILAVYVTDWAQFRPNNLGYFCQSFPRDIPAQVATHVLFAFAPFDATGAIRENEGNDDTLLAQLVAKKASNPKLKVLISVGGGTFSQQNPDPWTNMIASNTTLQTFVSSALTFIRNRNLDGIDIDWEYPNSPSQATSFTTLMRALRSALGSDLLLTFAAPVGWGRQYYPLQDVAPLVDFVNLMAYDLHGAWELETDYLASLVDPAPGSYDIKSGVQYYVAQGMPINKLVLGLPTYGATWKLSSSANQGLLAPASGAGDAGACTQSAGTLGYTEIKQLVGTNYTEDLCRAQAYATYGDNNWVSFDTKDTLRVKACYAQEAGLGGVFFLDW